MPISESDVKRQRKQHERQFEPTHDDKWGTLVTVNNSINPPGRPNWNWVDMFGLGTSVVPVINETMLQKPGTPVQIGNDPRPPGLRVIGPYTKAESPVSQVNLSRFSTGPHAQSHQYMSETVIGDDVAKIYQPALQPLKTTGDGTTLITITQPLIYNHGGLPKRFPGAPLDHTASVPTTTGHARRVLVYLDEVTQTITTIQGESVLDNGAIPIPYPEAPADSRISAYIKLSQGQTGISTANHIEDSRDWLGKGVTHFRHLADVDFSAAADGFVPTYDEDSGLIIMAAPAAGSGDVSGPVSSTDNAIARWDGTAGDTLQDSSVLISDAGNVGIGIAPTARKITLAGDILLDASGAAQIRIENATVFKGAILYDSGDDSLKIYSAGSGATPRMTIASAGQITIPNINVTGGAIAGITDLAIADGGTGASDGPTALTNLGAAAAADLTAHEADTTAIHGIADTAALVAGALGATDNAVLRTDGTGGQTAQSSAVTINDSGSVFGFNEKARVYNNANVSVNDSTETALPFNSEREDVGSLHDTVTNNTRLTAPVAGMYMIAGSAKFASNATGIRQLGIRLNGTTYLFTDRRAALSGSFVFIGVTTLYPLAANDYVELIAFHTAGTAINVEAAGNSSPEFAMARLV